VITTFTDNIIISIYIRKKLFKNIMQEILECFNVHLYEFEHNFEMQYICDIFHNFCLNNFISLSMYIKNLYFHKTNNNIEFE